MAECKVLILSDTHGFLDPQWQAQMEGCQEIWHAGDFGGLEVAQGLQAWLPLRGVFGNIDGPEVRQAFPEDLIFEFAGVKVLMTHIGGRPGRVPARARQLLQTHRPDLYICGHSHILVAQRDEKLHTLHLNPGACGRQGIHLVRTMMRLSFQDGQMSRLQVVELGPR